MGYFFFVASRGFFACVVLLVNMVRKRDLFDYAQLGLSAATAYKVSEMATELARLRESSDRQERKSQRLGQMRQMILMAEEFLERLEGDSTGIETPLKLQFVFAYETERDLKIAGVLPPVEFDSLADMERAKSLEKRIATFHENLLKTLPEDQSHDAKLSVQYMAEERELANLIMYKSASPSDRKILVPDGFDLEAAEQKFSGKKSAKELRATYIQRRDFVRGIVGPRYLARQDKGKTKKPRAKAKGSKSTVIPFNHAKPLTVTQSIGRGVVMTIIILAVVAALVGMVALFT